MGLIDKLDKSYVIIGLIKPFLDDKLYYITEHLDQVKVPWRVFREDDREPLIGFKWKDWIDRRRDIKNVLKYYLTDDMYKFKEYYVKKNFITDIPIRDSTLILSILDSGVITLDIDTFALHFPYRSSSIILNDKLTPDFWDSIINTVGYYELTREAIFNLIIKELISPGTSLYKTLKNLINRQII